MTTTAMINNFFEANKSVVSVQLTEWMEWASGQKGATRHVVLPMIQRGSVWAPHKLLDLWDTLLRGMPVGAMMASETVMGNLIKVLGEEGTRQSATGDIALIDGQQRTLSMLAGWPNGLKNPLRPVTIWVDLIDSAQGEYQFRLWATTKAQPFGYARASMGGQPLSKLERHKLRLANEAWCKNEACDKLDAQALWNLPGFMPWEAKFALPLTQLIANRISERDMQSFVQETLNRYKEIYKSFADAVSQHAISQHFDKKLEALKNLEDSQLSKRISEIEAAIDKVLVSEFPVIHVPRNSFEEDASNSPETNTDPPLAILFKRVGTGGTPLSNADYVYSVIKHYAPTVHGTVEELLKNERIRAIYTPNTLVMSAVRLTMLSLKTEDGKGQKITDSAKMDKNAFARLVRNYPEFINQFHEYIKPEGAFSARLKDVLEQMSYNSNDFKTGLPKHALSLVQIPLLETILAWCTLRGSTVDLKPSRLPMTRFALQGYLCVSDYAKASELAIKVLLNEKDILDSEVFPDQKLMERLSHQGTAYSLPTPDKLKNIVGLTESPDGTNGLRGWTRFTVEKDEDKPYAEIYKRWWNRKSGHVHPMLLWLQRDYVFNTFEKQPALAGMDEETPFDFDHILPSAHWAYWTGVKSGNRFIDFPLQEDKSGHWHIGNSIGNMHVLDSSVNRSLGDNPVCDKLKTTGFVENAQILGDHISDWEAASGEEKKPRQWRIDRALSFQRAVEKRTFALYSKFYNDLHPSADAADAISPPENS
jgi:hypothetical protein